MITYYRGVAGQSSGAWRRSPSADFGRRRRRMHLTVLAGGATEEGGQVRPSGRRRTETLNGGDGGGCIWAPMGLDGPCSNLPPRHLPRSDDIPGYSRALHAALGRLGHLSRTWWWWPSPPSEVLDQLCVARFPLARSGCR
jgi:hypothetical protein